MELSALDASHAAVLCADGTLELTVDGGGSWVRTEPDVEAAAVGVADDGYALAGVHEVCGNGVAITVMDAVGDALAKLACADSNVDDAGQVAVSSVGDAVWLWVQDEVIVLPAGGAA